MDEDMMKYALKLLVGGHVAGMVAVCIHGKIKARDVQISSKDARSAQARMKWGILLMLSGCVLFAGGVCVQQDISSIRELRTRITQSLSGSIESRPPKTTLKPQYVVLNPNKLQSQDTQCNSGKDGND